MILMGDLFCMIIIYDLCRSKDFGPKICHFNKEVEWVFFVRLNFTLQCC
jgi:hypothetical protein